jgi:hypothetical protein
MMDLRALGVNDRELPVAIVNISWQEYKTVLRGTQDAWRVRLWLRTATLASRARTRLLR